ncbi:hypothetical protein ACN3XK_70460 [Actinomadura welshii]|uniref:Uncharacterized protein n=1 Tax=Actinomadura livida TaxID=79909 RepID=A0A7W7N235_9ACTN|nr:hypothetical protein [Actinomadura catellatispora]MBB4778567.1 hypothetical protein [Actinomadura catellatispora]
MVCCCGTDAPARSHRSPARQPVSIASGRAGPHVSPARYAALDRATHSFHTHRHRSHSASRARSAVDDSRTRKV